MKSIISIVHTTQPGGVQRLAEANLEGEDLLFGCWLGMFSSMRKKSLEEVGEWSQY